jgi:hypothetical protein
MHLQENDKKVKTSFSGKKMSKDEHQYLNTVWVRPAAHRGGKLLEIKCWEYFTPSLFSDIDSLIVSQEQPRPEAANCLQRVVQKNLSNISGAHFLLFGTV